MEYKALIFDLDGAVVQKGNGNDKLILADNWIAPTLEEEGLAVAIERLVNLAEI